MLKRREFGRLSGLSATAALGSPSLALAQASRTLRFVPQADVTTLDGIANTQLVVRNVALLVFDTLYGTDAEITVHPQMCEGHELSDDGKTWTFTLRPGLRFHDGEPVLARDAVASIRRWMARDTMGQMIRPRLDAMEALDDRRFRLRLNRPFSKLLYAFGKSGSPMLLIMPERIANLDPARPVTEFVGSGPMRFRADEWRAGSRAVFQRFDRYEPRPEPASWLAGGKRMLVDRIEWHTMPDPSTAASALQKGEVDWWENPINDLIPLLRRNRDVRVDIADPLGNIGAFAMNHLQPPFRPNRHLTVEATRFAVIHRRAVSVEDRWRW